LLIVNILNTGLEAAEPERPDPSVQNSASIEFLASWILSTKRQAEVAQRQQLAQAQNSSGV
jgi:hypothetical protein